MARVRVPKNCLGFTLPDGRKVNANRRGVVEIPDRFAGAARRSSASARYDSVSQMDAGFGAAAEKTCEACAFTMFAWQAVCPRCKTPADEAGQERSSS